MDDEFELHPVVKILATLGGIASGVWVTWCTVIAFVGGTMPLLGWEREASLGFGLFFLFVLEPLVVTLGWWATALVLTPFAILFRPRRPRAGEH